MILVLWVRGILVLSAFTGIIVGVYYTVNLISRRSDKLTEDFNGIGSCPRLKIVKSDINTVDEYSSFDFKPNWTHFWEDGFDELYLERLKQNAETKRPPLKVILVPHSHNDAGWLKTFNEYFNDSSVHILDSLVKQLKRFPKMTFVWNDIAFLQKWWDQALDDQKKDFKELVDSGRLEITTGGWVMADEATSRYYPLLDQLIEGHQWLKANLNVTPRVGWAIDPFGHGSTMNYLLGEMGFDGSIIQRIHYGWKHRMARNQSGDFIWKTNWERKSREPPMITHNMPLFIYTTQSGCGPNETVCEDYVFEFWDNAIDDEDTKEKVTELMGQYSRTASLSKHNVVLVPLGADFAFDDDLSFERYYRYFSKVVDFVDRNPKLFNNSRVEFGTPKDYFRDVRRRERNYKLLKGFPTLKGDFFPYADIQTSYPHPESEYWTGYYSTRPIYKRLGRELEHNLRAAEILYTMAYNKANQRQSMEVVKELQRGYGGLVEARRNLGIFQHHDGVTGTSRDMVMRDYGRRLMEGINNTMRLQEIAIGWLVSEEGREVGQVEGGVNGNHSKKAISMEEREHFVKIPKIAILKADNKTREIVVHNSLARERVELVTLRVSQPNVKIFDSQGEEVPVQVNPVWEIVPVVDGKREWYEGKKHRLMKSEREFEVLFVATLPPLSLVTFSVEFTNDNDDDVRSQLAVIYCNNCTTEPAKKTFSTLFQVKELEVMGFQLENGKFKLHFDEETGLLKLLTRGEGFNNEQVISINFGSYQSELGTSGAYLFKANGDLFHELFISDKSDVEIVIVTGPIASEVVVRYDPVLMHIARIFHSQTELDDMVYMEMDLNLSVDKKYFDKPFYMRLHTDVANGDLPRFFTDANSFQYQMRQRVNDTGVEANYYPITSGMFIQDERTRVTLLTDHSMGGTSFETGQLEVMLDMRTTVDDRRGMGEPVEDSGLARHRFWLLVEEFPLEDQAVEINNTTDDSVEGKKVETENVTLTTLKTNQMELNEVQTLSWEAHQRANSLNYPLNLFSIEEGRRRDNQSGFNKTLELLSEEFPCDVHLVTARIMTDPMKPNVPTTEALLVLLNQPFSCSLTKRVRCQSKKESKERNLFTAVQTKSNRVTSLTGIEDKEEHEMIFDPRILPNELKVFKTIFEG